VEPAARIKAKLAYGSRQDIRYAPEHLAALRRDYHAARLAESIRNAVEQSGPFTPEQTQELTHIIAGPNAQEADIVS
jgi:hypothetical protein